MTIVPLETHWTALCGTEAVDRLDATAFLERCRAGSISREELRAFLLQQYFYSRHFTRYLCALLSNISNETDRLELCDNLLEEIGFSGGRPHSQIYRSMLQQMGCDPAEAEINPETQQLIDGMLEACRHPNPMVGLGALCLGAEAIVPHLYSQIVEGFHSVGEPDANLEFFLLHIESDDEHAQTMRRIIEKELKARPDQVEVLASAAQAILEARRRFFAALSQPVAQMRAAGRVA